MESDLRLNMTIDSSNLTIINGSGSSSKFRGVICLRSGRWGARIAFKYKAYWLGAYDIEEEAVMVHDRAAIKRQRSNAPLNFPMAIYTVQETKLQDQFLNKDILKIIIDIPKIKS